MPPSAAIQSSPIRDVIHAMDDIDIAFAAIGLVDPGDVPTTHLGPQAHAMEQQKGIETERGEANRQSFTAQQETAKLKRELADIGRQIAAVERESARPAHVERTEPPSFRMTPERLGFQDAARVVSQRVDAEREQPLARSDRAFTANDALRVMGPVLNRGAGLGVRAAAVVFGAAANAFESLIAPPRTPTIGELREINERQVAAGAERDRAFEKFLYDEEYEYFKGKQKEQVQQRQTERDYYERQKQNERER